MFAAPMAANGDADNNGNGVRASSAADEEGDSDAEHDWWPRVAGGIDTGEVGVVAERADGTNAE